MNRALQAFPSVDTPRAPEPPAPVVVNGLDDELLTVNDTARLLHLTVSWVYEHTRDDAEDRLPFVKIGKYVRFDRTDLREFHRREATGLQERSETTLTTHPQRATVKPQKARRATP